MGQYLREKDVVIGAEESGGFSFKDHISEKDGIFTCVKIVEVRAETGKSLSQLLSELQSKYGPCINRRDSIRYPNNRKKAAMEKLASNIPDEIGGLPILSVNRMFLIASHIAWRYRLKQRLDHIYS